MLKNSTLQISLLSMFALLPSTWAGAQSTQTVATSSASAGSSSAAPTEQQEMRDELKALRAEVERLRAEVEQQKGIARSYDRSEVAPAAARTGAEPNIPADDGRQTLSARLPQPAVHRQLAR